MRYTGVMKRITVHNAIARFPNAFKELYTFENEKMSFNEWMFRIITDDYSWFEVNPEDHQGYTLAVFSDEWTGEGFPDDLDLTFWNPHRGWAIG